MSRMVFWPLRGNETVTTEKATPLLDWASEESILDVWWDMCGFTHKAGCRIYGRWVYMVK